MRHHSTTEFFSCGATVEAKNIKSTDLMSSEPCHCTSVNMLPANHT